MFNNHNEVIIQIVPYSIYHNIKFCTLQFVLLKYILYLEPVEYTFTDGVGRYNSLNILHINHHNLDIDTDISNIIMILCIQCIVT